MALRLVSDDHDLHTVVEQYQRRALRAIGYGPDRLLKDAARWNERERNIGNDRPEIDLYDLVPAIFHERHYADRSYYDDRSNDVLLTQYDKKNFLDRFYNINVLCHRYFEEQGFPKRSIRYSSLPLSHVNGFCASVPEDQTLILLNEGVFYMLPHMIHDYPGSSLGDFPDDITIDQFNSDERYQPHSDAAERFLTTLINLISDKVSPSTMLFDPELRGPMRGGFETWKIQEELRASVRDGSEKGPTEPSGPSTKQLNFYRCRGFFTFLFAHEFSHAYRQHVQIRQSSSAVGLPYVKGLMDHASSLGVPHRYSSAEEALASKGFDAGKQPWEIEADSDALNVLQRYYELNELKDYQFKAMIEGVVMAMTIFELMDLIAAAILVSPQYAIETYYLDVHARNLLIPSEHPCARSRLELALHVNDQLPQASRKMIERVEQQQTRLLGGLWLYLAPRLEAIAHQVRLSPMIQLDGGSLFQGIDVMGHLSTWEHRLTKR